MAIMINAWEKLECLIVVVSVLGNNLKQENVVRKKQRQSEISPKGTNVPGTYRECYRNNGEAFWKKSVIANQ